jgi:hypothetical protein
MDAFEPVTVEGTLSYTEPQSAILGDYIIVSVTKFWCQYDSENGNRKDREGLTLEKPFGNEIKLALPLVDNPVTELPENVITLDQFKAALKSMLTTMKGLNR